MNIDQSGLYMCTAPGCTQRFQREDHLVIHRHKHEMILKFPSIKCDSTLSDQTPTPTRFLRNCEEVGLFSDLELDQTTEEEEDTKQNFALQGSLAPSQPHTGKQSQCQPLPHPPLPQQAPPPPQQTRPLSHQAPPLPQQPSQPQPPPHPPQQRPGPTQLSHSLAQFHGCALHMHTSQSPPHCLMDLHTSNTATTRSAPSCLHRQHSFAEACAVQGTSAIHLTMDPGISGIAGPTPSGSEPTPSGSGPTHQTSKVMPVQTHPVVSSGNQNSMGHMIMGQMMSSQQHRRAGLPLTHLPALSLHSYQQHCHGQSQLRHSLHHQSQDLSPHSCAHHSPHALLHQGPAPPTVTHLTHQPVPAQISPVPKSPPCTHMPPQTSAGKRRHAADEDPDERRRKFLERNRAAASRCRQKRKIWVLSLEKKAEELTHTNLQLQNEVTLLRSEVTQLKQILLAHKECPVTTRQRVSQVGSPTGSPTPTRTIQHNSLSASSTTANTRLTMSSHCAS
ncbi:cyclic AMP-responsive element-binding protein 5 [Electrophorus electricus]|uniref:cyclic AMP-responsive element-binding protein 5 n=1 Tax=Electrophorus electricus TaxID=8005 RepID=UPI0015D00762|nr:cyclic AMP-responsive element-binding protein 5 [Electrophorus electricus]XP_026870718.2 cyclic AMP-responsive element-binding protein 5 [Electrophorus electricus]